MLFKPLGTSRLQRVQGAYVSEEEIALVVEQTRQREQELDESYLELPEAFADPDDHSGQDGEFDPDDDPLLDKAIEIVVQTQTASVSLLQRRLRVGYTRAGRLVDMLERRGIAALFPGNDLVLPSLWQAISGRLEVDWAVRDESGKYVSFTPEMAKCW